MGEIIPAEAGEVRQALVDLVKLTNMWDVNPQDFVFRVDDGSLVQIKTGKDTQLPLCIVSDKSKSKDEPHLILNPFREGLEGFKKANEEFYAAQRRALYARFIYVIRAMIRFVQKQSDPNIDFDDLCKIDPKQKDYLKVGAKNAENKKKLADLIDDKSFDNIKNFLISSNQKRDFLYLRNSRTQSSCELVIDFITDPDYKKKTSLKTLREKDILALKTIVMGILGITKPEEMSKFSASTDEIRVPTKMYTFFSVVYLVYLRLNPFLKVLDEIEGEQIWEVEVDTLKEHIQNLSRYAEATKWSIVSSVGESTPVKVVGAPVIRESTPVPRVNTGAFTTPQITPPANEKLRVIASNDYRSIPSFGSPTPQSPYTPPTSFGSPPSPPVFNNRTKGAF